MLISSPPPMHKRTLTTIEKTAAVSLKERDAAFDQNVARLKGGSRGMPIGNGSSCVGSDRCLMVQD